MTITMILLIILSLNMHLPVLADEKITELYVIKVLEGEDEDINLSEDQNHLRQNIPLLSLLINFSP